MSLQSGNSSKPKLIPVSVPWMISPGVPAVHLNVAEFDARTVAFLAFSHDHEERVITITFENGFWFKVSPSKSESEVLDEQAYDWSAINSIYEATDDLEERLRKSRKAWEASSICPNPRMYEIENSDWLLALKPTRPLIAERYKHVIILGEVIFIEVICLGWNWSDSHEEWMKANL